MRRFGLDIIMDPKIAVLNKHLWESVYQGDIEAVAQLVRAGAMVDCVNNSVDRHSPLLWASESGMSALASRLIELGADVNLQGYSRTTPLMAAAFAGRLDIVRELLHHGANPNARNVAGESVLAIARLGRNTATKDETIRTLVDSGAQS